MKKKRLVIDIDEGLKQIIYQYSRANGRSMQSMIKHAVLQYMRQNPLVKVGEYDSTEE